MSRSKNPLRLSLVSVSENFAFHEVVAGLVAPIADVQSETDPARVHQLLRLERVHGLMLDALLPDRQASALASTFVQAQPTGRAVILGSNHGPAALMHLTMRSPRVELFLAPWNRDELMASLQGRPAPSLQE